ncbi:MAG: hypothetical protein ACP5PJ_09880, partial [Acidimicrobiales bacterium]
ARDRRVYEASHIARVRRAWARHESPHRRIDERYQSGGMISVEWFKSNTEALTYVLVMHRPLPQAHPIGCFPLYGLT